MRWPDGAGNIEKRTGYLRYLVDGKTKYGHRLAMEDEIGRQLLPTESVHHINGVRSDNRIENLELWTTPQPKGIRVADQKHCPSCTCSL